MKNFIAVILLSFLSVKGIAQYRQAEEPEEETKGGFKKNHLFTGGSIQFAWSSYDFVIGVNPVFGYSINKWIDVGTGLNYTYISSRVVDAYGYTNGFKIHYSDIAPVAFAKVYPLKFLFTGVQFEQNFISQKTITPDGATIDHIKYNVSSLLCSVGYCSGREGVGDLFYFVSLSVDVLKNKNSPYVGVNVGPNQSTYLLPIFRAGIQVPLFTGKGLF